MLSIQELFQRDRALISIHLGCLEEWRQQRGGPLAQEMKDPCAGWVLTTSDYWTSRIEQQAQEQEDFSLGSLCQLLCDLDLTDAERHLLEELLEKQEAKYQPSPNEIAYYYPRHSCHHVVPSALLLAYRLYPEITDFVVRQNERHSTVFSPTIGYFDVLLKPEEAEKMMSYGYKELSLAELVANEEANAA